MADPAPSARKTLLQSDRLSRNFVSVGEEDTIGAALEKIRTSAESAADIFYIYACDPEGRLTGVVPVRKLVLSPMTARIRDVMFSRIVKLPHDATDDLVEDFFVTYRLLAFPVVDEEGRIAGTIEVNQFVDAWEDVLSRDLEGRVRHEVFSIVGLPKDELEEPRAPHRLALRRFPWLLFNIAGGFLAATITRIFEHQLTQVVVMAAFIPLVLVLAESLGVQTMAVSTSLVVEDKWNPRVIRREVLGAALAGMMAALVVGALGRVYYPGLALPAALVVAVSVATLLAAAMGALLPFAFRRLKVDPKLASAPLVLAIADNMSLLTYFGMVSWLVT
ncbi:MAG: magnesium transporter [Myxococcaceae bacterium]|nr:magnesium transporter [Myxococcaceae bacterium]